MIMQKETSSEETSVLSENKVKAIIIMKKIRVLFAPIPKV